MFWGSAKHILKKVKNKCVVVVGLGNNGKELLQLFELLSVNIKCVFDNNINLVGKSFNGYEIIKPCIIEEVELQYVITPDNPFRGELVAQLVKLGIKRQDIIIYYSKRDYDYMESLEDKCYQDEISDMFRNQFSYDMNWNNPQSYNEIVNVEKLTCCDDELRIQLADKFLVRKWIEERIGKEYLTEQFAVWDSADSISFEDLPNQFMLKLNNGSGKNIAVYDKNTANIEEIKKEFSEWMKIDFSYSSLELHYRRIKPRIICEKLLESSSPAFFDCKLYCFHGKIEFIQCIRDEHKENMRARCYDLNWNLLPINHFYPDDELILSRPKCMDKIIELTKILCKDFPHVRVDWFVLPDERILFSEMTFSSWSGLQPFRPYNYDYNLGERIRNC